MNDAEIIEDGLCAALRMVSSQCHPWLLDQRSVWNHYRDVLLGHPRIRGGQRPRDFPLDPESREVISLAARLNELVIAQLPKHFAGLPVEMGCLSGKVRPFRFGDWLRIFAILVHREASQRGWPSQSLAQEENPYRHAILTCQAFIRRGVGLKVEQDRLTAFDDRILGTLGLNRQECRGESKLNGSCRRRVRELAGMAAASAMVAVNSSWCQGLPNLLSGRIGSGAVYRLLSNETGLEVRTLAALDEIAVPTLTLKTAHVQAFLHGPSKQGEPRGASAWCAQALAQVRDLLGSMNGGDLLLNESSAHCTFLADERIDLATVGAALRKLIQEHWAEPATLKQRIPRLAPAIDMLTAQGEDLTRCLPDFVLTHLPRTSLLSYCLPIEPLTERQVEELKREARSCGDQMALSFESASGGGVITAIPPWWEPGNSPAEPLTWTTWIASLAGAAYRLHTLNGMIQWCGGRRMTAIHHGDLMERFGLNDEQLAQVKLDGDRVGQLFGTTTPIQRPGLSLLLSEAIYQRFRNAVAAAQAQRRTDSAEEPNEPLVVDLNYLEGDDLLVTLPGRYADAFLAGFASPATPHEPPLTFTFARLLLPARPDAAERKALKQVAAELVQSALEIAKSVVRDDSRTSASLSIDPPQVLEHARMGVWRMEYLDRVEQVSESVRGLSFKLVRQADVEQVPP